MENRKITIVSTRTQKKYVIMSAATTLAELKADLDENRIDYTDMSFMEGLTKTELVSNDSLLPKDVVRRNRATGAETVTNELVFMLTNNNKKIASGIDFSKMTRSEAYDYIRNNKLQKACYEKYGKAFCNCTTEALIVFIAESANKNAEESSSTGGCALEEAFRKLVSILVYGGILDRDEEDDVLEPLNGTKDASSPYTDDEIEEMFGQW